MFGPGANLPSGHELSGFRLCTFSHFDWWWDTTHERAFLEADKAERPRPLSLFFRTGGTCGNS
jgi:hypothetical protein